MLSPAILKLSGILTVDCCSIIITVDFSMTATEDTKDTLPIFIETSSNLESGIKVCSRVLALSKSCHELLDVYARSLVDH